MFNTIKTMIKKKKFFKDQAKFFIEFAAIRNKYVDLHNSLCEDVDDTNNDASKKLLVNQLDAILTILTSNRPLATKKQHKTIDDDYEHLRKIVKPPEVWFGAFSNELEEQFSDINMEFFTKCIVPYTDNDYSKKHHYKSKPDKIFARLLECYANSIGMVLLIGYSVRFNHNCQEWVVLQMEKVKKLYE